MPQGTRTKGKVGHMELELLKGPLDSSWLVRIANLYGRFNLKYADARFCGRVFNENPSGFSLHAVLVDKDAQLVGHYGIVPGEVVADGASVRAGKGEAFVVHPDHRGLQVAVGGDAPVASGLVMPLHLYRLAESEGLELVHMMTSPDVGQLHRMTGCRSLPIPNQRWVLTVRPLSAATVTNPARGAIAVGLAGAQWSAAAAVLKVSQIAGTPFREWRAADIPARWLARVQADMQPRHGWGLTLDSGALRWQIGVGDMRLISPGEDSKDFALVCPRADQDRIMEIVCWHQPRADQRSALRLMGAIVRSARAAGNCRISFSEGAAGDTASLSSLRTAGRTLFFRARPTMSRMYLRTNNRYFLAAENLRYTPFFYAAF